MVIRSLRPLLAALPALFIFAAVQAQAPLTPLVPGAPAQATSAAAAAPSTQTQSPPAPAAEAVPEVALPPPLILETVKPDPITPNEDLWARIRRGYRMPELTTDLAEDRTRWYAAQPAYISRMSERASIYLYQIVLELERRNMPTELALLPFVESAFRNEATSHAKAAGMWQFIPSTGKQYQLKQNIFRDDRRHALAATTAALDYLSNLYGMFNDWHLALAAYNWGEGSVQRAIAKNQRSGLGTGYLDLQMPQETRYYVPKLQAIKNIIANPGLYNITLPSAPNHAYFDTVSITRDLDVALAAKLADMSVAEFQTLNPSYKKPVILAASKPELLLPYDNAAVFRRNYERQEGRLASWTATTLAKTEKPAAIAARYGISEAQLRAINGIPPRMLIKAGSVLVVPRAARQEENVTLAVADNASLSMSPEAPPLRRAAHRVRKGESFASIAKRYRTNVAQLKAWNKTAASAPKAGQVLTVYVANKGKSAKFSRSAKGGKSLRTGKGKALRGKATAKRTTKKRR